MTNVEQVHSLSSPSVFSTKLERNVITQKNQTYAKSSQKLIKLVRQNTGLPNMAILERSHDLLKP